MKNTAPCQNIFSLMLTVCMLSACGTESDATLYGNAEMLDDVEMESEYAVKANRGKCYKKVLAELASGKSRGTVIYRLGKEIQQGREYSISNLVKTYRTPSKGLCMTFDINIEALVGASLTLFNEGTSSTEYRDEKNETRDHLKDIKKSVPKPKKFSAESFRESFLDNGQYKSALHEAIYDVMAF